MLIYIQWPGSICFLNCIGRQRPDPPNAAGLMPCQRSDEFSIDEHLYLGKQNAGNEPPMMRKLRNPIQDLHSAFAPVHLPQCRRWCQSRPCSRTTTSPLLVTFVLLIRRPAQKCRQRTHKPAVLALGAHSTISLISLCLQQQLCQMVQHSRMQAQPGTSQKAVQQMLSSLARPSILERVVRLSLG